MCLAQGPQRNDAGEARTRGLSVSEFKVIFDLKSDIFLVTIILCFKVVRDTCQKITLLLLKSKSVRVIVPESCF